MFHRFLHDKKAVLNQIYFAKFEAKRGHGCNISGCYIKTYYAKLKAKAAILIMVAAEITLQLSVKSA
jgi:hypothetical protein